MALDPHVLRAFSSELESEMEKEAVAALLARGAGAVARFAPRALNAAKGLFSRGASRVASRGAGNATKRTVGGRLMRGAEVAMLPGSVPKPRAYPRI